MARGGGWASWRKKVLPFLGVLATLGGCSQVEEGGGETWEEAAQVATPYCSVTMAEAGTVNLEWDWDSVANSESSSNEVFAGFKVYFHREEGSEGVAPYLRVVVRAFDSFGIEGESSNEVVIVLP